MLLEHDADPLLYALEPSAGRQCQQLLEREGLGLRGEIESLMAQIKAIDNLGAQIQSAKTKSAELHAELERTAKGGNLDLARELLAQCEELEQEISELKRQQAEMGGK